MPRRLLHPSVLLLCLLARSANVSAQTPPDPNTAQAREAWSRGMRAVQENRFADAASALEESYRLRPSPIVLYNLAVAYRALGRYRTAIDSFERYLASPEPNAPAARIASAREELQNLRTRTAQLELTGLAPGAQVLIDGRPEQATNGQYTLDPGAHVLQITAEGFAPFRQEFTANQGARVQLQPTLVALVPTSSTVVTASATPPPPPTALPLITIDHPAPIVQRRRGFSAGHAVIIGAGALVAVGAGLWLGGWASGNGIESQYLQRCRVALPPADCTTQQTQRQGELDGLSAMANAGWIVSAVGTVGVGVGVFLLVRRSESAARAHLSPALNGFALRW